jgi:DNA-binding transcriptional MerR regulator/methylmalonyl-CoA mutase cobalamin-binding subunit
MENMMEKKPTADDQKQLARHPIQVVSRRTGLSNDVIRAWEKRYGVVTPERQETGRRLYSDADVHRLVLLQKVTTAGRRISEVAGMENAELEQLLQEDRRSEGALPSPTPGKKGIQAYLDEGLRELLNMNPSGLHRVLVQASAQLPLLPFLDQVVGALLEKIGKGWKDGALRVGHEHMAIPEIRRFLISMLGREQANAPVVLISTPTGQRHELGALMAAIAAESEGWRVLYLGPDLPATEIATMAIQSKARAVALSMQARTDEHMLREELRKLALALPDSVPVVVGGRAVPYYRELLEEVPAHTVDNLMEFVDFLGSI